jgi:hypothetical protein
VTARILPPHPIGAGQPFTWDDVFAHAKAEAEAVAPVSELLALLPKGTVLLALDGSRWLFVDEWLAKHGDQWLKPDTYGLATMNAVHERGGRIRILRRELHQAAEAYDPTMALVWHGQVIKFHLPR